MPRPGRKEEILNIACRLFSRKGYHGTTIRDISDACGILSGSLYAHINSKEDLLYEITERGASAFLNSLRPIAESADPPVEKLRQAMRAHIRVIEQNLEAATVFFHEWKALSGERLQTIREKRDEYENLWTRIIHEGIDSGQLRQMDEKYARLLILSAGNWVYQWYRPGGSQSADEIADRFVDMLLNGFGGKRGDTA
jgi:TetR/AcrR family transcriptional regulator, cholesterol catabolism regulator